MRTLISGNISINIRANNMARLYYRQEFQTELDNDLKAVLNYSKNNNDIVKKLAESGSNISDINKMIGYMAENEKNTVSQLAAFMAENNINLSLLYGFLGEDRYKTVYPGFEAMKIIWAMAQAEAKASNGKLSNFEKWLEGVADFDVNDCPDDFLKEVEFGFFRISEERKG